jgi:hypothetical protein
MIVPKGRPIGFTEEDEIALRKEFTVAGSCGCDGAYDNGCPFCNDKKFDEWWLKRRRERSNLRIVPNN